MFFFSRCCASIGIGAAINHPRVCPIKVDPPSRIRLHHQNFHRSDWDSHFPNSDVILCVDASGMIKM